MGMDLEPINPSDDAPFEITGNPRWGRYNWCGWNLLIRLLEEKGLDTSEFSGCNDGEVISDETCKKVANILEALTRPETVGETHSELDEPNRQWLESRIELWRTCGGYRQW